MKNEIDMKKKEMLIINIDKYLSIP